jgi:hypothetical protein
MTDAAATKDSRTFRQVVRRFVLEEVFTGITLPRSSRSLADLEPVFEGDAAEQAATGVN